MLSNLHEIAINSRQRFRDEFSANEVILSQDFKEAYKSSLLRERQNVDFTAHTAVVTTSGNLKMYIPNQWFCAAVYTVDFIQVFLEYKRYIEEIVSTIRDSVGERKEYIRGLKDSGERIVEEFRSQSYEYLKQRIPVDELDETVSLLTRFVTDYDWWFGSKTIDRSDAYVSPTLSLLGVLNASQGYIADISYKYATESQLAITAKGLIESNVVTAYEETIVNPTDIVNYSRITGGVNEIVYGAPGTGKSKYLDDEYSCKTHCTRVVFHPEYTFFDFIGSYKPVTLYKITDATIRTVSGDNFTLGEPMVDYRYVPGPFIHVFIDAWLNPTKMYTLIIEEINRANTAAVFGEVFQLLDRDVNGTSEYSITPSDDLAQYLSSVTGMREYIEDGLRIPSNLNLVATMNSADQGVMPIDSAFKRRWSFKYYPISIEGAIHENAPLHYAGQDVPWGVLVRSINAKLMKLGYEEDRLVGPYFIRPEEIGSRRATDKLLLYLWDDVLRHNRNLFFNGQISTFAELSDSFDSLDVFDLLEELNSARLDNCAANNDTFSADESDGMFDNQ